MSSRLVKRQMAATPNRRAANGSAATISPNIAAARHALLDRLSEFFLSHELDVTSTNLATVCSALSGSNARLAQEFAQREMNREPIDQRWIDTVARLDPGTNDRLKELETLMDKLEYSLMRFAQTAKSAHDETCEHRGEMARQIGEMTEASREPGQPIKVERVIDLSRAMLDRLDQVEAAMERSQSETDQLRKNLAKARTEADVDHLTRLPNRRAFERRLLSAADQARSKSEPLCVAFCDVDHFKKINDTHGHDAGDRVLCTIADTLAEIASDECFIARHGGEEFVLLFYGLSKDQAWLKLDGARRALGNRKMVNRETGKPFGRITFSAGIAEVTEDEDTRSALVRADTALYQAKEAGRNQIKAN